MNRFDTVFDKLGRAVLIDSETTRVTLLGTDDGASAGIEAIREFAASLNDETEPNTVTAGHADTVDVEMRGCTW